MSAISLYSNKECTETYAIVNAGEYALFKGFNMAEDNTGTYEIDGETITLAVAYYMLGSRLEDFPVPTDFTLPMTDSLQNQIGYIYFTPNFRISYKYINGDTVAIRRFGFGGYEYDFGDGQGFKHLTSTPEGYNLQPTYIVAGKEPLRIIMATSDTAVIERGGVPYTLEQSQFISFNVTMIDNTGSEWTYNGWAGISNFDDLTFNREAKPYKPKTGNRVRGGTGTGYYPNSEIPKLPTDAINNAFASILGRGNGLTYYEMNGDCLEKVTEILYNNGIVTKIRGDAYRDAVASLIFVPVQVPASHKESNSLGTIYLANITATPNSSCDFIVKPLVEIDFGEVDLRAENIGFGNYGDYVYTNAVLYLPCFGNVDVDMTTIARGVIHIRGVIDVRNGDIVYRVETRADEDETYVLLGHYNGNCGLVVPVGGSNAQIDVIGALTGIGMTIGGAVSGDIPVTLAGALKATGSVLSYNHVSSSGAMRPAGACLSTPVPILQIQKHILLSPINWTKLHGETSAGNNIPADVDVENAVQSLSDFSGFVRCSQVNVSGITRLNQSEKDELVRLLKEGVFV